jgi:hypothetical protein
MNIKIRKARPEDVKDLTELSIRSKRSNGYDEAFMAACREELTVTEDHLADGEYWVAESGVVCGCAKESGACSGKSCLSARKKGA